MGPVGPPARQALLCALVLRVGPVSRAEILWSLWGDQPPVSAVRNVQSYVSGLRQLLGPDHLRTVGDGYQLMLPDGALDLREFHEQCAAARDLRDAGDNAAALDVFEQALGLWRGVPLAGVPGPFAEQQRGAALESFAGAVNSWAELAAGLRPPGEIADQLLAAETVQSLPPRLVEVLWRSLDAAGRRAEAVAHSERVRPAAELAGLADRLRQGEPIAQEPAAAPVRVPAELPHDVHAFVGRQSLLEMVGECLAARGRAPRMVLLHGVGGAGKTALAVHFGHQLAAEFPDGALYVDLLGSSSDEKPLSAADALGALVRSLGVEADDMPLPQLVGLYRTHVAGRRLLIQLDDAVSVEQVRPLLPGSPEPFVLITSRSALPDLVIRDGVVPVRLGTLDEQEALELLAAVVGADRVAAEPDAARALTKVCGLLPLPLRMVGQQALLRPEYSLADLLAELMASERWPDLLSTNDVADAMRVVMARLLGS